MSKTTLNDLNQCSREDFVRVCGPFFEHSPWIAEQAFAQRPFADLDALHRALCNVAKTATADAQIQLIASHPDLVGRLAREGKLTHESTSEQASAGLNALSDGEIELFSRYNAAYRDKFGFPFVICARENRKDAILAALPTRLRNSRDEELLAALEEITKIARLRLLDAVCEST